MSKENVETLCKKAAETNNAGAAQSFAQAALSVAQAMCTAKTAERMGSTPPSAE